MAFRAGWASVALTLLLAASLVLKWSVGYERGPNDIERLSRDLEQRLRAQGFATVIQRGPDLRVVHAVRGDCHMFVRDGDSWPVNSLIFQKRARRYGPLLYVYRGGASAGPPRIGPLFDRMTRHVLRSVGVDLARPALLAVAAAPACGPIATLFGGVTVSRMAPGSGNSLP